MSIDIALPGDVTAMLFVMVLCQLVTALGVGAISVTYLVTRIRHW